MKALTLALIFALPFSGMAAWKHKAPVQKTIPQPAKVIEAPLPDNPEPPLQPGENFLNQVDKDSIIDQAEKDLDDLQKKLDDALASSKETKIQLDATTDQLNAADKNTVELQKKIDEETNVLNMTREALNAQIKQTEVFRQQYNVAEQKLWFWRKIAIAISLIILLYIGLKVLKVMGKLPIPLPI